MIDIVDGALADAALLDALRRHIDGCASCKSELKELKAVFGSLKQDAADSRVALPGIGKFVGLTVAVRREVGDLSRKSRERRSFVFRKFAPVAAVAVIAFAALFYNTGNKTTVSSDTGGSLPAQTTDTVASSDAITFDEDEIDEFFASSDNERYALPPGLGEKELDNVYADVRTMGRLLD